jgi:hypothetical protein
LFLGVFFGLLPGVFQPLQKIPSLIEKIRRAERTWMVWGIIFMAVFLVISSWPLVFGEFTL